MFYFVLNVNKVFSFVWRVAQKTSPKVSKILNSALYAPLSNFLVLRAEIRTFEFILWCIDFVREFMERVDVIKQRRKFEDLVCLTPDQSYL